MTVKVNSLFPEGEEKDGFIEYLTKSYGKLRNSAIPPSLRLRRTKGAMVQWCDGAGVLMEEDIRYKIIFSARRSISLIVSPDKGVTVRAPYRTSLRSIERFVREKEPWIRKHLEKYSSLSRINHGKQYSDGEAHYYKGKSYNLRVIESSSPYIKENDEIIEIGVNDTGNAAEIRKILERWYRKKAQEFIDRRFEDIVNSKLPYRFLPSGFVVRPLKSRWGSCTAKGRITINSELIKLDPVFTDYVIIHELCHLRHHNHGKEFYRLLEEIVPDYKMIRKDLRKYLPR